MKVSGQSGAVNYRILDARYALMNCLSVSAAGELYQGRDLERLNGSGLESRVLIHIMPTNWAAGFNREAAFGDLCVTVQNLKTDRVLPVLDHGAYGVTSYFVLESPPERNLQALTKMSGDVQRLQKKAINWLDNLGGNQSVGLEPGLLLLTPTEEMYVTATNLLPGIGQDNRFLSMVGGTATRPKQLRLTGRQFGFAGLLSLGAMAAAASAVGWYNHGAESTSATTPTTASITNATNVSNPQAMSSTFGMVTPPPVVNMDASANQAVLADVLLNTRINTTADSSASTMLAAPQPVAVQYKEVQTSLAAFGAGNAANDAHNTASAVAKLPSATNKVTTLSNKREQVVAERQARDKAAQAAAKAVKAAKIVKQAEKAKAVDKAVVKAANLAVVASVPPQVMVTEQPVTKTLAPEVVDGDVDAVIQAAYAAAAQGKLGDARGGAMYYLRQLRELNRIHPQIKRIARQIASHYHNQVRDLLAQGRGNDALPTLRAAKSVIMEFNLAEMNSAHDVLLHKVGSF